MSVTPRLVLVEWVDSQGGGGWKDLRDALRDADENTLACESVGWLLKETEDWVLLAGTVTTSSDRQVCDPMQIPRCAVARIRSLVPGRSRR